MDMSHQSMFQKMADTYCSLGIVPSDLHHLWSSWWESPIPWWIGLSTIIPRTKHEINKQTDCGDSHFDNIDPIVTSSENRLADLRVARSNLYKT